ncbi:unnamed protein product [Cyprideis torosa]|uniref:Uncharacterized protein n=1 Tax=Cyprideis torosa TaxID=163714 RepID=A0A7R8ZKN7_9CRUS|nr:unnamed protein product [Cyprideis torosa]CAG0884833.1 unnamed protein product [Cyprideis torosa]
MQRSLSEQNAVRRRKRNRSTSASQPFLLATTGEASEDEESFDLRENPEVVRPIVLEATASKHLSERLAPSALGQRVSEIRAYDDSAAPVQIHDSKTAYDSEPLVSVPQEQIPLQQPPHAPQDIKAAFEKQAIVEW